MHLKGHRISLCSAITTAVLAASAVAVTTEPAQADAICHTTWEIAYRDVGTYYPVTLHGTTVYLQSGSPNGSARAKASLRAGDILTLDRSKYQTTRKWSTTTQVMNELNGYDYCGITASTSGTHYTQQIEGYQNAIRVCLRRSGALQCSNMWYADQDG
ncbi:hypothetical protein [Streptomyces chromofuscus]|uniref:Secreted protein n=1 Tax=Streptomyces chromofuscus TaxID=42881 RepID=A0A7M2TA57_STRCW|nr:hypothetical protein [Streptomyces chromofuscus]QOV44835.1 hypothetical protein IPT68_02115 [Streptomyces chromofuscus]GGT33542.1 hypothetical protein GCM10010254_62430 [Streptomyces chromofuscus]